MYHLKNVLYGDGIHDDLPAIQEMLDSGIKVIYLPPPEKNYLISGTIFMHSNQELKMDRHTIIRLADGSNCPMIEDADDGEWNERITVSGGIWDMNNINQKPNPMHFPDPDTGKMVIDEAFKSGIASRESDRKIPVYTGSCFRFYKVKEFYFGNITIRNPVTFGLQIAYVEDFTIENLVFDYNQGSPKLWNMDGVHVEGGCKNGLIKNLKGTCHDDTVALTSDDATYGPIENIVVDGIYSENTHSAVRLLSRINALKNIHITNVFGSFYTYCIILSKFYADLPGRSGFENITIDNVYASHCKGTDDVPGNYTEFIMIGNKNNEIDIKNLKISNVFRTETHLALPTIAIYENTNINNLSITNCVQTNETGSPITFLRNNGNVQRLFMSNNEVGQDTLMDGDGFVGEMVR